MIGGCAPGDPVARSSLEAWMYPGRRSRCGIHWLADKKDTAPYGDRARNPPIL